MSGDRRDRRAWAPNAPNMTPKRPPSAPISRNVRSNGILISLVQSLHDNLVMRRLVVLLLVLLVVGGPAVAAQFQFFDFRGPEPATKNIPYDGRFTFARLKYTSGPGGFYYHGLPAWAHGYSEAEGNLMRIVNEISFVGPHIEESNVFAL